MKRVANLSGIKPEYRKVSIYHYIEFEGRHDTSSSKYLENIIKSVSECKAIEIEYQSYFADTPSVYIIHPCLLKQYKSSWYLLAYFQEEDKIKTFAVDRFKSLRVRDDIDFIDKRFNSWEYFKDSVGITVTTKEPVEVHLSFTNMQAKYVMAYPLHSSQEIVSDNGSEMIIKYFLRPDYEFISQILAWGDQVKVLKPANLVSMVRERIESALKKYS